MRGHRARVVTNGPPGALIAAKDQAPNNRKHHLPNFHFMETRRENEKIFRLGRQRMSSDAIRTYNQHTATCAPGGNPAMRGIIERSGSGRSINYSYSYLPAAGCRDEGRGSLRVLPIVACCVANGYREVEWLARGPPTVRRLAKVNHNRSWVQLSRANCDYLVLAVGPHLGIWPP